MRSLRAVAARRTRLPNVPEVSSMSGSISAAISSSWSLLAFWSTFIIRVDFFLPFFDPLPLPLPCLVGRLSFLGWRDAIFTEPAVVASSAARLRPSSSSSSRALRVGKKKKSHDTRHQSARYFRATGTRLICGWLSSRCTLPCFGQWVISGGPRTSIRCICAAISSRQMSTKKCKMLYTSSNSAHESTAGHVPNNDMASIFYSQWAEHWAIRRDRTIKVPDIDRQTIRHYRALFTIDKCLLSQLAVPVVSCRTRICVSLSAAIRRRFDDFSKLTPLVTHYFDGNLSRPA